MPRDDRSPTARQCIDELIAAIKAAPESGDPALRKTFMEWIRSVRGDRNAVDVLDAARDRGADLRRLVVAAALYRSGEPWMCEAISTIRFGPLGLSVKQVLDIRQEIATAERVEAQLHRQPDMSDELRFIDKLLKKGDAELGPNKGKVRTVRVSDGKGGFIEKRVKLLRPAVGVVEVGASVEPTYEALRKMEGKPGDPALDVLVLLIMGHLRAVAGEAAVKMVADIVVNGFKLGDRGGTDDVVNAMRNRAYRARDNENRAPHRERARWVARMMSLKYDLG